MEIKHPKEKKALKGPKRRGSEAPPREKQAGCLCCKFPVCWSQPFKWGDAKGLGLGWGGQRKWTKGACLWASDPALSKLLSSPSLDDGRCSLPEATVRGRAGLDPRLPGSLGPSSTPTSCPLGLFFRRKQQQVSQERSSVLSERWVPGLGLAGPQAVSSVKWADGVLSPPSTLMVIQSPAEAHLFLEKSAFGKVTRTVLFRR